MLLSEGFGDWSRRDFLAFIRACETLGSANIEAIARELGKAPSNVERYLQTFNERYGELADGERWMKRVKAGDDVRAKNLAMEETLARKLASSK